MRHSNRQPSPLIAQVRDILQRARKLPVSPARNDLRQLAQGLLKLHRAGFWANIEILFKAPRSSDLATPRSTSENPLV
jgi:hypothetical protein